MMPCRIRKSKRSGGIVKPLTPKAIAIRAIAVLAVGAGFATPYFLVPAFHVTAYAAAAAFVCAYAVLLLFPHLSVMSVKRRLSLASVRDDPFAEAVFVRCNQFSMAAVFACVWYWALGEFNTPQWSLLLAAVVARDTTGLFKTVSDHLARVILLVAFYCKRRRVLLRERRRAAACSRTRPAG